MNDEFIQIAEAMVAGVDEAIETGGVTVQAGTPLTLERSARHVGVRLRRAREIASTDLFHREIAKQIAAFRASERARNLHVAIAIRDDIGDGTAATKTARLKAIATIEGRENAGNTVNVQINNQNNVQNVSPGYIIRLDDPKSDA